MKTTAQVAELLGVAPRTIRDRADRYGLGAKITNRLLVFSDREIAILREHVTGKPGRPKRLRNAGRGNDDAQV